MTTVEPVVGVDAIDAAWMTHVLRHAGALRSGRVIEVGRERCGTGQLGDSYRFTLAYDPPDAGPATVVGKFASDDANSREFGRSSGYYRNEIRFYDELASGLPISIPSSLHAALSDDGADFVLIMEDLSPARSVDQLTGCLPDEMGLVVEQIAALHAASWRDPRLMDLDWLQGTATMFQGVTDAYPEVIRKFPELCGDLVPQADLDEAAGLVPFTETWKRELGTRQCLWHSDIRADNVLFDARDGTRPVVLLDWQGLGYGAGTLDVGLCLGTSLTIEDRREHERDLVTLYHEGLLAGGVTDYGREDCWNAYRRHAVHGLQVGVFGLGAVRRTARGDQMWKSWIERTAAQVRDLESYAELAKS